MPRPRHSSKQARTLFAALLDRPDEWLHGYDLIGLTGLASGTLYPLLIRLADEGLLDAEWREPVPPARIPRHVYRLTREGRAFAAALVAGCAAPQRPREGFA